MILLLAFLFYGVILLISVGGAWLFGDFSWWFPPRSWQGIGIDVGIGVGGGLILVLISLWMTRTFSWGKSLAEEFAVVLGPLKWWEILGLALLSGICEEALFRAALLPHIGLFASSVLFALAHVGRKKFFLGWTAFAFVFGLIAGSLFQWRLGLLLPATLHITVNLINLYWITRFYAPKDQQLPPLRMQVLP
tara:strand:- start:2258 stop:2833 length:576 start_codon:yes stop_codon:yes gene_type:complete